MSPPRPPLLPTQHLPRPAVQSCTCRSPWRTRGTECWAWPLETGAPAEGSLGPALRLELAGPLCPSALDPLAGQRGLEGQPRVSFWRRCDAFRMGSGGAQRPAPGPRCDWRRARPCSTQGSAGHRLDRVGRVLAFCWAVLPQPHRQSWWDLRQAPPARGPVTRGRPHPPEAQCHGGVHVRAHAPQPTLSCLFRDVWNLPGDFCTKRNPSDRAGV